MDPLYSRNFLLNPKIDKSSISEENAFTIVSYNILAECHALRGLKERNEYSFSTEGKLLSNYRHTRIWKEIEYLDADIYCLQEVSPSYFTNILLPAFKSRGYKGEFFKRAHPLYDEGEATFYNATRFSALNCQGYILHDLVKKDIEVTDLSEDKKSVFEQAAKSPAVFLITQLQCNTTGSVFSVANIHTEWENMKRPDLKCLQITTAIKELLSQGNGAGHPHVFCGDFNLTPACPGYQLTEEGKLNEANTAILENISDLPMANGEMTSMYRLFPTAFRHNSPALKSAYQMTQGREPISSFPPCLAIDFVWYSADVLKLIGVLETADAKLIEKGIPDDVFPSDHLSLKAKLIFA